MAQFLLLRVHLHDRFHGMAYGEPEWPPAPARVFQALIAGAATGRHLSQEEVAAFRWLEGLGEPIVGAPRSSQGEACTLYVPNNDLDSVGGDPSRVGELKTKKLVIPRLLEGDEPVLYLWAFDPGDHEQAHAILRVSERLSHLGRGIDPAWAQGELLNEEGVEEVLRAYPGEILRPVGQGRAVKGNLACPVPGSFDSTERRFHAKRISEVSNGRRRQELFQNAPRPIFVPVRYRAGRELLSFELVDREGARGLSSLPLRDVARVVEAIRDTAARRLTEAFAGESMEKEVERLFRGKLSDGRSAPAGERLRLIPLPSIGHEHADLQLRRLVVELPASSEISRENLAWAFEGLVPEDAETKKPAHCVLAKLNGTNAMLGRYCEGAKHFRSVTPLVLPDVAARRRIEPTRKHEEAKGGAEREQEESRARTAVHQALRHAGVRARVRTLRVQREPLSRRGLRAECFAMGTRFAKERLWHVEIEFAEEVSGPLVLGDGRFLGLGLMRPVSGDAVAQGCWAFSLDPGAPERDAEKLVRAFRRAVLARVGAMAPGGGRRGLDAFFSGHDGEGGTDKEGEHLAFQWDPHRRWLMAIAPHRMGQRPLSDGEGRKLRLLDRALAGFHSLHLGGGADYAVEAIAPSEVEQYGAPSRSFESVLPYTVMRHLQLGSAHRAMEADVAASCERSGLPRPQVRVLEAVGGRNGLQGSLRLEFSRALPGPLLLGKTRFLGGGLFLPAEGADGSVSQG